MTNPSILPILALVSITTSAVAGSPPTALPPPPPVAEEEFTLGAELSVGYDSHYIFRGEELQENSVWGQLEIGIPLCEEAALTLTPWYESSTDSDYSEVDLNASLDVDFKVVSVSAGYAGYFYPRGSFGGDEGIDDEHEAFLSVTKEVGPLEFTGLYAYNFDREAGYLEASVGATFELTPNIALAPAVAVGYSADYYGVDGFTHVQVQLGLPIKLTKTATLTPYIAGNIPLEVLNDWQDERLYGGVSLAVTF